MGDVIHFPQDRRHEQEVTRMKESADQLDRWILDCVQSGTQPHEIAGVMAHRLGSLIRHGGETDLLIEFCEGLIRKQAEQPSDQGAS